MRFEEQLPDLDAQGRPLEESPGQMEATTQDTQNQQIAGAQQRQFDPDEVEEYNG